MKKLAIFIVCGVVLIGGWWLWITYKPLGVVSAPDNTEISTSSEDSSPKVNGGIRVWGSLDEQKSLEGKGYLPREVQYGDATIRVEEDTQTPLEGGYAEIIHYKQNNIRVREEDKQLEGRGAPMVSNVTVEMLGDNGTPRAVCFEGNSGVAGGDGAYDVFVYGQYVITSAWSYSGTMFTNLNASVCDLTMGSKEEIAGKSSTAGGAVQMDIASSVNALQINDASLKSWLPGILQKQLDTVNALVPASTR